jgi:lipopolysaccharide/colanic/teichoic acid biosynthesis glycosyltransferase
VLIDLSDASARPAEVGRAGAQRALKRGVDVVVAAVLLLVSLPVVLAVALLIRLDSPGPVLFRQTRVGAGGRRFRIVKFRTMVRDAEQILQNDIALRRLHESNSFKLPVDSDPRVTRVGRWLRRTSVDELPQLWNVLCGDMSLVGARPVEPAQVARLYGGRQEVYLRMRPGLTGPWQVSGRSHVGDDERVAFDTSYVENWRMSADLRILARTVPAVLRRRGAH